jgi:hypothetical protein
MPNSKLKLKISVPYPDFPDPNIELKITDDLISKEVNIEAVEGKGEAPWIRRSNPKATVQFTSKI